MYSINNRSERKENAWKFLSFLLEEDIQFLNSKERIGTPISQEGVDRMIEDAIWMHDLSGSNIDRYNKSRIENSQKIDYLYDMGYMRDDILNAIKLYMDGETTLDEALKKAEENVMIRLNEQKYSDKLIKDYRKAVHQFNYWWDNMAKKYNWEGKKQLL